MSKSQKLQEEAIAFKSYDQAGNECWEVESILDKKYHRSTKNYRYLVKWRGWEIKYSTWEPIENLTGAEEMLRVFEKNYQEIVVPLEGPHLIQPEIIPSKSPNSLNLNQNATFNEVSPLKKSSTNKDLKQDGAKKKQTQKQHSFLDSHEESSGRKRHKNIKTVNTQTTNNSSKLRVNATKTSSSSNRSKKYVKRTKNSSHKEVEDNRSPLKKTSNQLCFEDIESPDISIQPFELEDNNKHIETDSVEEESGNIHAFLEDGSLISILDRRSTKNNPTITHSDASESLGSFSFKVPAEFGSISSALIPMTESIIIPERIKQEDTSSSSKGIDDKLKAPIIEENKISKENDTLVSLKPTQTLPESPDKVTPKLHNFKQLHNVSSFKFLPPLNSPSKSSKFGLTSSDHSAQSRMDSSQGILLVSEAHRVSDLTFNKESRNLLAGGLIQNVNPKSLTMPDQLYHKGSGLNSEFERPQPKIQKEVHVIGSKLEFSNGGSKGFSRVVTSEQKKIDIKANEKKPFDVAELIGFCSPTIEVNTFNSDEDNDESLGGMTIRKKRGVQEDLRTPRVDDSSLSLQEFLPHRKTEASPEPVFDLSQGKPALNTKISFLPHNTNTVDQASGKEFITNKENRQKEKVTERLSDPVDVDPLKLRGREKTSGNEKNFEKELETSKRRNDRSQLKETERDKERDRRLSSTENYDERKDTRETLSKIPSNIDVQSHKNLERDPLITYPKISKVPLNGKMELEPLLISKVIKSEQKSISQPNLDLKIKKEEESGFAYTLKKENDFRPLNNQETQKLGTQSVTKAKELSFERVSHAKNPIQLSTFDDTKQVYTSLVDQYLKGELSKNNFLNSICLQGNFKDDRVKEIEYFSWDGFASMTTSNYVFKIKWEVRPDGTQKEPSIVSWDEIKKEAPKETFKYVLSNLMNMIYKYGTFGEI